MDNFNYFIAVLGVAMVVYGIIIWRMQKITWILEFNKSNVKKEDIKDYTMSNGIAYMIMGSVMALFAISENTEAVVFKAFGIIIWWIGFFITMVIIVKTQKKYKTGIFN